jgi:hypothetical protein
VPHAPRQTPRSAPKRCTGRSASSTGNPIFSRAWHRPPVATISSRVTQPAAATQSLRASLATLAIISCRVKRSSVAIQSSRVKRPAKQVNVSSRVLGSVRQQAKPILHAASSSPTSLAATPPPVCHCWWQAGLISPRAPNITQPGRPCGPASHATITLRHSPPRDFPIHSVASSMHLGAWRLVPLRRRRPWQPAYAHLSHTEHASRRAPPGSYNARLPPLAPIKKKEVLLSGLACHPCAGGHANLLCIFPIFVYVRGSEEHDLSEGAF